MNGHTKEKPKSWIRKALKILLFPFLIMVNPKIYFFDLEEDEEEDYSVDTTESKTQMSKDSNTQ